MTNYDRVVIQQFAEKLYKRANSIIASYAVAGVLLGGVVGYFLGDQTGNSTATAVVVAVVVGLVGFAMGRTKAFLLKLQAQTALCQMKIEQNTSGTIV